MIWTLILVLFVLWMVGFNFKLGGNLIHTLLVIVLILMIAKLLG